MSRHRPKRKSVATAVLDDFPVPEDSQLIARITEVRGGGQYDACLPRGAESEDGAFTEDALVVLPTKFKNVVWLKRGGYVIVAPLDSKTKVWGEIVHVLFPDQIKHLKSISKWPTEFEEQKGKPVPVQDDEADNVKGSENERIDEDGDGTDDDDDDLFVNTNRRAADSDDDD
ncbi:hypothetical protein BJ742DRAFT_842117 [Cladochytrium replicatum]|nr:hypothetical protein BJ742DRAFT_842117 [Cladochytrium replicatum]